MSEAQGAKPERSGGLSTRGAVLAGLAAISIVVLAALAALFWPEIELRYHRWHFRRGTPLRQSRALEWIAHHRLEKGMTEAEVAQVLGGPLEARLTKLAEGLEDYGVPSKDNPYALVPLPDGAALYVFTELQGTGAAGYPALCFVGGRFVGGAIPFVWEDEFDGL